MKEGDTEFIYGPRGAGKTWFTELLLTHLSIGHDIDEDWTVPVQRHLVLVDGEMPWDDIRARFTGLKADENFLHILHHEVLFERTGLMMNLTDKKVQKILTELCLATGAKLLALDTLSSLFRGLNENEADDREKDLRRRRATA
jgi:hypothetical protein